MSVYKYDENTQTMREYDIAYQVEGQECPDVPNSLENVTLHSSDAKLKVDNSWLPYFGIEEGTIKIGQTNDAATDFWNAVNDICLAPTDVPIGTSSTGWSHFNKAEQIYINNSLARWPGSFSEGEPVQTSSEKRSVLIDTHNRAVSRWLGNAYHDNCPMIVSYVPNGTVFYGGPLGTNQDVHIICGNKITVNGIWENRQPQVIYYNDNADFEGTTFADAGYTCQTISFDDSETKFLDNYFSVSQDGETLPWYTGEISNEYGKYIRLSKNDTKLIEECIYSYENFVIPIEQNLTDTAVVRTGTYTKGDTTKTYSITLEPIKRTVKARMYFNPVEQDGKMYNNFCMWPFNLNFNANDDNWNRIVQDIVKIRYKAVGDTTWTDMTLPTASELQQKSMDVAGHVSVQIIDLYTAEINTAGYYDVEWMYYADNIYSRLDTWDPSQSQWVFSDRKIWYDYTNHTYEVKENEDMYIENTPFVVSMDYGKQYGDEAVGKHGYTEYFSIRNWDDNPRMETLSMGPCNSGIGRMMFGGMMSRGLKYLVYNNIERGTGDFNWVNCENYDSTFSNEGILFYVNPERQRFDDWFLGCTTVPHIIYLHPDIYAMTNHGFDDTVTGWESGRYSEVGSPELRELPNNWRELVPNYIGE